MSVIEPLLQNYDNDAVEDDYDITNNSSTHSTARTLSHNGGTKNYLNGRTFQRRSTKLFRWFLYSVGILLILLMVYIPIFNSVYSRTAPVAGWDYNRSRNISDYVFPNVNTALIEPRSACLHDFFLLIVVTSSVNNFIQRQTIRQTWGNVTEFNYPLFAKIHSHLSGKYLNARPYNVRLHSNHLNISNVTDNFEKSIGETNLPVQVLFLIGKNKNSDNNKTLAMLKLESERYDDIIQENFIDTYNNLTIKSVMMLKWIQRKCSNRAKFVLKCDDDTFVNIPNLLHILLGGTVPIYNDTVEFYDARSINALSPSNRMLLTKNLLSGYLFCSVKPVEWVNSKWYAPIYMFNGTIYPNYISGSSYIMSFDVIEKLYKIALETSVLHLEDVYLTGICAERIGLKRRHNALFSFHNTKKLCSYKGTITQHYLKYQEMENVYNFVKTLTEYCPPPNKYFKMKRLRPKNCS